MIASRRGIALGLLFCLAAVGARAQSDKWDSVLEDSYWYVPQGNMLAYSSSNTSFADPVQIGDQTLWSITDVRDGVFGGTVAGYLGYDGVFDSSSASTVQGIVAEGGQIRMIFTDISTGTQTTGIGQMQEIDDVVYMQMQMVTGSTMLVTHWAYMAPYDPDDFTPPWPNTDDALRSPEWEWMLGTTWSFEDDEIFGEGSGEFTVSSYVNGYFWGSGAGPGGEDEFTMLGSVTPEGTVLFNLITDGVMSSLAGQISGDGTVGGMSLWNYDGGEYGSAASAVLVVPEPGTVGLLVVAGGLALLGLRRGWFGRAARQ